jgi:hypothetical protein
MAENTENIASDLLDEILKNSKKLFQPSNGKTKPQTYTHYNKKESEKRNKAIEEISAAVTELKSVNVDGKTLFSEEFLNSQMWTKEILTTLQTDQLLNLSGILSHICRIKDEMVSSKSNSAISGTSVETSRKQLLDLCEQAIKTFDSNFVASSIASRFGGSALREVFAKFDKGESIDFALAGGENAGSGSLQPVSEEDLKVVAALKLTGVDLKYVYSEGKGSWILPEGDTTPKYELFAGDSVFSRRQVEGILHNYLNKPVSERNGRVTPDALFKVFMEELRLNGVAQTAHSGNKEFDLSQINLALAEKGKIYNSGSLEFDVALLIDDTTIMKFAQKHVLAHIYGKQLEGIQIDSLPTTYSDDLSMALSGNQLLSSRREKHLRSKLANLADKGNDITDYVSDEHFELNDVINVYQLYDNLLERLKARKKENLPAEKESALDNQIGALIEAKARLETKITFMQSYLEANLKEDNPGVSLQDQIFRIVGKSSRIDVKRLESGEITFATPPKGHVSEDIEKALKNLLRENSSDMAEAHSRETEELENGGVSPEVNTAENTSDSSTDSTTQQTNLPTMPDIFFKFTEVISEMGEIGNDYNKSFNNFAKVNFVAYLFGEGQPLDIAYKNYMANPNIDTKSFDDFIQSYVSNLGENSLFTADEFKAGYVMANPDKADEIGFDKNKINTINDDFKRQLVLLDLATQDMSAEEVRQYLDNNMPAQARNKLIESKIKNANTKLGNLTQEQYVEAATLAERRLKNGVLNKYFGAWMKDIKATEDEMGKEGFLSKALDTYVKELGKNQEENNAQLASEGKLFVDPNKVPDLDNEKQAEDEYEKIAYGKLYPSGPSMDKFLKKMKPYNGKAVVKTFLEPLLGDIEKMDVRVLKKRASDYRPGQINPAGIKPKPENAESEQKPVITQRTFEASNFMPGYFMLDELTRSDDKFKNDPVVQALKNTLGFMCSTEVVDSNNQLCMQNDKGRDFRDEMRSIALDICGGKYKSAEEIQKALDTSAEACSVSKDNPNLLMIKQSFDIITPEMLNFIFGMTSEMKGDKLVVGSRLPAEALSTAKSDRERRLIMSDYYLKSMTASAKDNVDALGMLISDIYREKGKINEAEIKRAFDEHQITNAEFYSYMKFIEEQKKKQQAQASSSTTENQNSAEEETKKNDEDEMLPGE